MAAPLKDEITVATAQRLATAIAGIDPGFDPGRYIQRIRPLLDDLELKDRVNLLADELASGLDVPNDYPGALATVVALAETEPAESWAVGMFAAWPLCSFVERHGVDHPTESLAAMPALTKRWSCEFAIRPFLEHHLDETWDRLLEWRHDQHEAVRRLVSEGTRPLLPWATRVAALTEAPERGLDLIAPLRTDPSETVRRSVANHLNDVAKADPVLVTETLTTWLATSHPPDDRLVSHGLRTLVKRGDPAAMRLLGFDTDAQVEVEHFGCQPAAITLGQSIELSAVIRSTTKQDQHLVVDYVIHHPTATGDWSTKVFKWTNLRLPAAATLTIEKRRAIKAISTRTYHPGLHRVELQVAGQVLAATGFD